MESWSTVIAWSGHMTGLLPLSWCTNMWGALICWWNLVMLAGSIPPFSWLLLALVLVEFLNSEWQKHEQFYSFKLFIHAHPLLLVQIQCAVFPHRILGDYVRGTPDLLRQCSSTGGPRATTGPWWLHPAPRGLLNSDNLRGQNMAWHCFAFFFEV